MALKHVHVAHFGLGGMRKTHLFLVFQIGFGALCEALRIPQAGAISKPYGWRRLRFCRGNTKALPKDKQEMTHLPSETVYFQIRRADRREGAGGRARARAGGGRGGGAGRAGGRRERGEQGPAAESGSVEARPSRAYVSLLPRPPAFFFNQQTLPNMTREPPPKQRFSAPETAIRRP
jgi:hypothetical protein